MWERRVVAALWVVRQMWRDREFGAMVEAENNEEDEENANTGYVSLLAKPHTSG